MGRLVILVALIFAGAYVAHGYVTAHPATTAGVHCYTIRDDTTGKSVNTCHLPTLPTAKAR
jgi:hypothetical protein